MDKSTKQVVEAGSVLIAAEKTQAGADVMLPHAGPHDNRYRA